MNLNWVNNCNRKTTYTIHRYLAHWVNWNWDGNQKLRIVGITSILGIQQRIRDIPDLKWCDIMMSVVRQCELRCFCVPRFFFLEFKIWKTYTHSIYWTRIVDISTLRSFHHYAFHVNLWFLSLSLKASSQRFCVQVYKDNSFNLFK